MRYSLLKTTTMIVFLFMGTTLMSQSLEADFGFKVTCRTVVFTDSSKGKPTFKLLKFGDGNSLNVSHTTYTQYTYKTTKDTFDACYVVGLYDSSLSNYRYDTICKQIIIDCDTCSVFSWYSYYHGYDDDCNEYHFLNHNKGPAYSFFWNFGDGDTSTQTDPVHTYANDGEYFASLVTNFYDSTISRTCTDSVAYRLFVACDSICNINIGFTFKVDSFNCSKIHFTNTTTGTHKYNYSWSFANGSNSSLKNPTITYSFNATYYVKLIVSYYDSARMVYCSRQLDKRIDITCIPCGIKADFSYKADSLNCYRILFSNKTYDSSRYKYKWTFGDGSANSKIRHTSHQYNVNDTYYVKLLAYDSLLSLYCKDSIVLPVIVLCSRCGVLASLTLTYDSTRPYTALLYNNSTGNISRHFWDFGDSSTSDSAAPTHIYNDTGTYILTYIAEDTLTGCRDTTSITFTIDSMGNIKRQAFILTVVDNTTGIRLERYAMERLKVYPNPVYTLLTVENINNGSQNIRIYDTKGVLVGEKEIAGNSSGIITVADWPAGLYILVSDSGEKIKVIKY